MLLKRDLERDLSAGARPSNDRLRGVGVRRCGSESPRASGLSAPGRVARLTGPDGLRGPLLRSDTDLSAAGLPAAVPCLRGLWGRLRPVLTRGACALAFVLAVLAGLGTTAPAQAQTSVKLVGNGTGTNSLIHIGWNAAGDYREAAPQFTTGGGSGGYTLTSASVWFFNLPSNADVTNFVAANTCPAPTLTGRMQIWTGTVTVGSFDLGGNPAVYGFGPSDGALDDTEFSVGINDDTVDAAGVDASTSTTTAGRLSFSLTGALAAADLAQLTLHVCDAAFALTDATVSATEYTYTWADAGLDWSSDTARTLYLSLAGGDDVYSKNT